MINIEKILSTSIRDILSSLLVLDLMQLASIIKYNGSDPTGCPKCLKAFHEELKILGINKIKKKIIMSQEIKERTCVPAWKGNKYFSKAMRHYNDKTITDEEALRGLKNGTFPESAFEILPAGMKEIPKTGSKNDPNKKKESKKQ